MIAWLFRVPMVRAYLSALMVSLVPMVLIGVAMSIYVHSSIDSIDKIEQQVAAAQTSPKGTVPAAEVTERAPEVNFLHEWIIFYILISIFAGVSLRLTLGRGSMAATERLVDDARAAAGGDLTVQPTVWFANEYGELPGQFRKMVDAFRQTIRASSTPPTTCVRRPPRWPTPPTRPDTRSARSPRRSARSAKAPAIRSS